MRRPLPRHPVRVLLLALGFVLANLAVRVGVWWGLGFLDPQSLARNLAAGVASLGFVAALTAVLRRRAVAPEADFVLVPRPSRASVRLAALGLAAGGLLFGAVFALALATGGIAVRWVGPSATAVASSIATIALTTVLNASWEEFTFRGWPFSVTAAAFGPHLVTIGTGLAFGLVHVLNPEWSAASLASVSLAGLLLGWTMVASRNLLVPIGLHVAWNLVQSLLTTRQFWEVIRAEDVWLSGGREGLEASAAGLTITGLGAAVALAVAVRRSRNGGAAPAPGTPAP